MTRTIHDSGYKRLFSNKTIFRQLIEIFIEEGWVQELDFEGAVRLDKSFITDHYKETESDIIYGVPLVWADGSETTVYFYVLIEFQSTVQRFMAVRVLHYLSGFYLDYLLTHGSARNRVVKLPAILPIVLYNGDDRWTPPTNIAELIEPYPPLGKHKLDFEYFKIIENEFSLNRLLGIRNIISALFIAEAYYDLGLLNEVLLGLYDHEPDREAVYFFLNWFKQLALHGRVDEEAYGSLEEVIRDKEEVQSMLLTAIERERRQIREEGWEEGREEGWTAGIDIRNRQIVQAMHERNYDIAVIADVTGLSIPAIKEILAQGEIADQENDIVSDEAPPLAPADSQTQGKSKSSTS